MLVPPPPTSKFLAKEVKEKEESPPILIKVTPLLQKLGPALHTVRVILTACMGAFLNLVQRKRIEGSG
jgi:hypothetical protein